jgi:hypothetical protein
MSTPSFGGVDIRRAQVGHAANLELPSVARNMAAVKNPWMDRSDAEAGLL